MIKKLAIPLSLVAAATLAACASPGIQTTRVVGSAEITYVASVASVTIGDLVRPGVGKVSLLTDPAGPVQNSSFQYVTLKMNDGSTQALRVIGVQLEFGETIRIRSDNTIARHL